MKKILIASVSLIVMNCFAVVTSPRQPSVTSSVAVVNQVQPMARAKTAAPANGTVTVNQPVYTLRLNSNPTTGYSWFVMSYPPQFVRIVSHQFVPSTSGLIGAGGIEVWQFQARKLALAAPTIIAIKMMYTRPWNVTNENTAQTFYIVTQ